LLTGLAADEPKPHKNALVAGIERGFVPALQNVSAGERGAVKKTLAEGLNREEGLELVFCLTGHTDWVNSAVFSPDGRRIVSGGEDRIIRIRDLEN
jgi:WD40 repeat protein